MFLHSLVLQLAVRILFKKAKFVYIATIHRHLARDAMQSCDALEGAAASIIRVDLADSSENSVYTYQKFVHSKQFPCTRVNLNMRPL
jgi:hypothetical protein